MMSSQNISIENTQLTLWTGKQTYLGPDYLVKALQRQERGREKGFLNARFSRLNVFYINHWKKHKTCTEEKGECMTCSQFPRHSCINYFSYAK